jgi:UDP-N-acetylglucosamine/UDP-N-acetylgalactosamine 4-epimerase
LIHTNMKILITGGAGFIGSNLAEHFLAQGHQVTILDNLATGHYHNIEQLQAGLPPDRENLLEFVEGDTRNLDTCRSCTQDVEYVLHQAALGSVPRSIANPLGSHQSNVNGFLNMQLACRDNKVRRMVFASSSSVYGDHPDLPKEEDKIGEVLSPYALSKKMNELQAATFQRVYGLEFIGLRYFNVFGRRQDPEGVYAAVIPRWIMEFMKGITPTINGDGETSRDFCYIDNVIQANERAMLTDNPEAVNTIYNVAAGGRTTLNQLYTILGKELERHHADFTLPEPEYAPFRSGDILHSFADIGRAQRSLQYRPSHDITQGIQESMKWYLENLK